MEKHPNAGIAKGFLRVYSGSNRVSTLENMNHLTSGYKHAGLTKKLLGTGGSVYRVKGAKKVGGFDESIRGAGEDTDIAFRMSSAGWESYIVEADFSTKYVAVFQKVWKKSFWYGYGAHLILHKHKELGEILPRSTPLAGFLEGVLTFSAPYKLTNKKIAFLLPLYYFSKNIFWCFGFAKSHMESYGH